MPSLFRFFRHRPEEKAAARLYAAAVVAARQPFFYTALQTPDSVDGRFDMLALHLFLLLNRLGEEAKAESLKQELLDMFVRDMDANLREMGVGDLSVGKRVRRHAAALYGRLEAYRTAFHAGDQQGLACVLQRNIYRSRETPGDAAKQLAAYAWSQADCLKQLPDAEVFSGSVAFQAAATVGATAKEN